MIVNFLIKMIFLSMFKETLLKIFESILIFE